MDRLDVEGYLKAKTISGDTKAEQFGQPALPVRRNSGRLPDSLIEFARQPAVTASPLPRGQQPELFAFTARTQANVGCGSLTVHAASRLGWTAIGM